MGDTKCFLQNPRKLAQYSVRAAGCNSLHVTMPAFTVLTFNLSKRLMLTQVLNN